MADITTRRALEVVLARVPMSTSTRSEIAASLGYACRCELKEQDVMDADALKALIAEIDDLAMGVSEFPRKSLLARISLIRESARRAL